MLASPMTTAEAVASSRASLFHAHPNVCTGQGGVSLGVPEGGGCSIHRVPLFVEVLSTGLTHERSAEIVCSCPGGVIRGRDARQVSGMHQPEIKESGHVVCGLC